MRFPALRFKEFSDNWKIVRLEEIYPQIRNGFVGVATPFYAESGIKYLQGKNIKNGAVDATGLIYISEEFHNKYKKSQLRLNDIVMVQSGHVGECSVVNEEYVNANCHALVVLTPKNPKITSSNFFVYYFYTSYGKRLIYQIKTGNTIEHILASEVKELSPYAPTYEEQTKIANFLTAIDEKITQLTQKYDLLNQYKKGVMQQIFSQELRFKDDDGQDFPEWELSELGEFIDEFKEKSTVENQHRVLTSARTGLVPQDEYFEEGRLSRKENLGFNIVPLGFVTYRSRSDDGIFKFNLNTLGYTGIISTYYPVFNLINCSNKFFIELTEFYKGDFGKYSVGTSQTVLSLNVLKKIEFMFPCFDEQTKIANFLTAIDDKITATQTQLQAVKQYKQGLLQQMFV